ncbi:replication factor A protein 1-like [Lotus japonicus]|uniref:replication factor A protein 1-like n=1 Tax=Lotus japonicus TaxID=34305 RepID=UPI00258AF6DF|nr:replication factor A protein 1-like [Lotus japonicus]
MDSALSMGVVNSLCPPSQIWRVVVRVIRLWVVYAKNGNRVPKSVEMVLMDHYGGKIQCSLRNEMFIKWGDKFEEGNAYKITFGRLIPNMGGYRATQHPYKMLLIENSLVSVCEISEIPRWGLSLRDSEQVRAMGVKSDYLIDFMGLLTSIIEERTCVKKGKMSKMMIVELCDDKGRVECVLFDDHAKFVTDHLSLHSNEEAILVFQFAKINKFRGKSVLQGVVGASRLSFNPQIPEVMSFWNGIAYHGDCGDPQIITGEIEIGEVSMVDDFINNHPRKTLLSLSETKEDGNFIVRAKIVNILKEDGWWYLACLCDRAVIIEDSYYYCSACFTRVNYVSPRFRIKVKVSDGCDSIDFVMPDSVAEYLVKKSCREVLSMFEEPNYVDVSPCIEEALVGKDLLFKVEKRMVNLYNYEDPYHVKRVCNDTDIIDLFTLNDAVETPNLAKFPGSFSIMNIDEFDFDFGIDLLMSPDELVPAELCKPKKLFSTHEYGSCSKSYKRKLEEEFDQQKDHCRAKGDDSIVGSL